MKAHLIPISLCLLADSARAECRLIDAAAAQTARQILTTWPEFVEYCEPCGESVPGVPQLAKSVTIHTIDVGDQAYNEVPINNEVSIDGRPIDLAYVFVKTHDSHYHNLATLVGRPVIGVSRSLIVEAETNHGVMITADRAAPPVPSAPVVTTPPAVPPTPPTPRVVAYSAMPRDVAWLPVLLASAGGLVVGSAGTLVLLARRRRRDMRPRAIGLSARAV